MLKDATYYRSAIEYNEGLAVFAADLAEKLEDEEVQRWCRSVSKQHKFHAGRHKKALAKLEKRQKDDTAPVEQVAREKSIAEQQAEFHAELESQSEVTDNPGVETVIAPETEEANA